MPHEPFQIALEHHRAGRLRQAEAGYRAILDADAGHADALHWLGVLLVQAGQARAATPLLERAATLMPSDPAVQFNLGRACLDCRLAKAAIEALTRSLELDPSRAPTMTSLASAHLLRRAPGDVAIAIDLLQRARAAGDDSTEIHLQLSSTFLIAGRLDESAVASRNAIEKGPASAPAHLQLALVHRVRQEYDAARRSLQKAIEARNGWAPAWHAMAMLEFEAGDWKRSADLFQFTIDLEPDDPAPYHGLARALDRLGKPDEAVRALREAVGRERAGRMASASPDRPEPDSSPAVADLERKLTPTAEMAEMHLAIAAWKQVVPPSQVPAVKVTDLFERYADRFDEHLQGKLGYRVPELVAESVAALDPTRRWDVLDLGCGTGLCGALLRPMAKTLVGVDLSPAMIAKAAARGVYDRLEEGDLVATLRSSSPQAFDLLVAADVLIYLGDLLPLFEAARRALRPGGVFIFTVEACGGDRFILQQSQRFAHSRPYLEHIAAICGFETRACNPILVRQEAGKPISGFLVVTRLNP